MKAKITKEFLIEHDVCEDGYDWWLENCKGLSDAEQIKKIRKHSFSYTVWLITESISPSDNVTFAIYCAELVLPIYEKEFPGDKKLRSALENLKNNPGNQEAIDATINAAWDTSYAARGELYSAWAVSAVWAAGMASAIYTASSDAADATRWAAENSEEIKNKIMDFGINLMRVKR